MMDNIEELKQQLSDMQEKLQQQEKLASLGTLSAGIAHEVQNPLNFVINFSKLSVKLLEDLEDIVSDCADRLDEDDAADMQDIADDLRENLGKIQEHGERAISIIRGILLQSRGKSGEFLPVDIEQLVHEYVWLSYHAVRANNKEFNVSIHEEYQENMPKVMVIPQDLSRAVLNIMNNACYTVEEKRNLADSTDYTPTIDVKVELDTTVSPASLTIRIADNGMGMSEEVKTRIFENFYTTKPVGKGTGLGMGIMREIITKNHNGQVNIESEEGKGSAFTFIIPVKTVK
ncbi:MAG: GHKL domain-containing protein [Prevotella sp.]|nr:GHKL domain-containing protein [Candidatus Equicola stercoris]